MEEYLATGEVSDTGGSEFQVAPVTRLQQEMSQIGGQLTNLGFSVDKVRVTNSLTSSSLNWSLFSPSSAVIGLQILSMLSHM